jgi:hypothetical protein
MATSGISDGSYQRREDGEEPIRIYAVDRMVLSAMLLEDMKTRHPRAYRREVERLKATPNGQALLELSHHPERWGLGFTRSG